MVYCGLYPNEGVEYDELRDALDKLKLNDAALVVRTGVSVALGFGFRCGFLGLLHMEIVQERLERDYGLDLIATSPSVVFRVTKTDGQASNRSTIRRACRRLRPVAAIEEPYVKATIIAPPDYVGSIMDLAQSRRGTLANMEYLHDGRVIMTYEMPLIEIIVDFFDVLKSRTKGYASLDYDVIGYREGELAKLEILLNGEPVDALSFIVSREKAAHARTRADRTPEGTHSAPDVRRADSGGDRRQDRRPRDRQARFARTCWPSATAATSRASVSCWRNRKYGKKRMKRVGRVELPQEAFMAVLRLRHD